MQIKSKKTSKNLTYLKLGSSRKNTRTTQGVVAKKKSRPQHVASLSALSSDEIALLLELRAFLENVGLGKYFGHLGRNQAILHHELLHDDPNCRALDENGYKRCILSGLELGSLCELCDNEASILEYEDSNFVKRIDALLARHCPKGKGIPPSIAIRKKFIPKLHPNFSMLPELPPFIDTSLLSGCEASVAKKKTSKRKDKKNGTR